ncbi:hypothetical protein CDAR_380761 [Caerostris darwini]|uniref:Uncharacterized protein n=1 Tax=Caerostris darwini TaxID=1538125 RepID=A0AAV4QPK8_9ARAC|nr:hypothetical protein CDAR_380761 [Caerostris darwini]
MYFRLTQSPVMMSTAKVRVLHYSDLNVLYSLLSKVRKLYGHCMAIMAEKEELSWAGNEPIALINDYRFALSYFHWRDQLTNTPEPFPPLPSRTLFCLQVLAGPRPTTTEAL